MITPPAFRKRLVADRLRELADLGVCLGTSSWKYPGWLGLVYDEERYLYRGKFSRKRFEGECLAEYAEVFPTVCVDASYYRFPLERQVAGLCAQVPAGFRFSFKVTEEITVARFPSLPRYRSRRGARNPNFLDAESFKLNFLRPLEAHAGKTGLLIFEFSRFKGDDFRRGREIVDRLDTFLGSLPGAWSYGVEIRNRNLLRPEYFDMLRSHGVAHIFSSWEKMPGIGEQITMPGSRTAAFLGARLLLKPGRGYARAVDAFSPYDRIREELPEVRAAVAGLIRRLVAERERSPAGSVETGEDKAGEKRCYIYVNNRLEGNSLFTIEGILERLGGFAAGIDGSQPSREP